MKRDFNYTHVYCGSSPLKLTGTEATPEEPESYNEKYKGYTKEKLFYGDLHHGSSKSFNLKSGEKLMHNKENQKVLWGHIESTNEIDNENDSGYSSLLGIQHKPSDNDDSVLLAGNINNIPNHSFSPRKNLLPVLHFEELVCSTLKKTNKRNPKSWALFLDKLTSRKMEFVNLIGKKMGLDKLDILGELFHGKFRHLLANILMHLNSTDLINMAKVSITWKKILLGDKWAFQMYNKALKLSLNSNTVAAKQCDTREYALHREPLMYIQKVAPKQINFSKKTSRMKANAQTSSFSRHSQFSEVAKTLKNTESLKVCHRCGSPAKYDSHLQRATCVRESCGFDFCTKCMCSYHSAKDCCIIGMPVKTSFRLGPLPCSKKSKQNLRRL
ncbi:peptide chain release factor 1-like, mitochondrial isoform X1 [Thamnophis elegans]|uniref:peptide chain release factor 1-like, mitochondrial isoform X1 n=1 Tax=Thamnophis elegans TaxID=35005 RepID=UPI0013787E53|nr:peptide chain release factor 1-like, mitochondrial isoform X1 [Thamnophis elegans]XP_032071827.1 peptide chain release factor 1-like, mitochondrial isoform X1 [Thamnophis elegans]